MPVAVARTTSQEMPVAGCVTLPAARRSPVFAAPALADPTINWWTIDAGGGTSTGGSFTLSGTIGQFDASTAMAGGSFRLVGGFWGGLASIACGPADIGRQGGVAGADGVLDNNDFVVFIDYFFTNNPVADVGQQGGVRGADGVFDNNDFVVFIDLFFTGC